MNFFETVAGQRLIGQVGHYLPRISDSLAEIAKELARANTLKELELESKAKEKDVSTEVK